jgi:quinoprotein glucose dehydrogenase
MRFAALADITRENVQCLERAWTYHTGDSPDSRGEQHSQLASEVTPILADGTLYFCTPFNRVIALDPATGAERWTLDPKLDLSGNYANQLVCRGVSTWLDPEAAPGARCRRRILTATNDARLFALDAADGTLCPEFGAGGSVDLNPGVGAQEWRGEYQVTSPPAVSRDAVIVGSAVSDNQRTDAPSGVVRAYDARSGVLRWAWDLRPPDFVATPENTSPEGFALATPNVWAPMAVDEARDLVFVPTGNPAPDYYRGDSHIDHYGSSVVSLRASTGERVWHFQTVHRDLWDFDVPAQPTLFSLRRAGREIPALVQTTKMGLLFVLDRETGEPLFPVEERAVPQISVHGEKLADAAVSTLPRALSPGSPEDAFGFTLDRRVSPTARAASLRGHVHAADPRGHAHAAGECGRLELGWRRGGRGAAAARRQHPEPGVGGAARAPRERRSGARAGRSQRVLRVRADAGHALRDAPHRALVASRCAVQSAALG